MANGTVPPGYTPPATPSAEDKKREFEYKKRSKAEQGKLSAANAKARNEAIKRKGQQKYNYKSFSNPTDFGAGAAGPGLPYSIKTTKVPERAKTPKTPVQKAAGKLDESSLRGRGSVQGLWPVTGKAVDWKLAAIKRRLGNG